MNYKETIALINEMQAQKIIGEYAIGGAVGANFYLEASDTEDLDVFVPFAATPDNLLVTTAPLYEYARSRGWEERGQYIVIAGWPVQFLPPALPPDGLLVEEAIKNAIVHNLDGIPVRVFAPEYLVAIALKVGRVKDKLRAQQFLETSRMPGSKFTLDEAKLSSIFERHGLLDRWHKFKTQIRSE